MVKGNIIDDDQVHCAGKEKCKSNFIINDICLETKECPNGTHLDSATNECKCANKGYLSYDENKKVFLCNKVEDIKGDSMLKDKE